LWRNFGWHFDWLIDSMIPVKKRIDYMPKQHSDLPNASHKQQETRTHITDAIPPQHATTRNNTQQHATTRNIMQQHITTRKRNQDNQSKEG
jgi:hypothetical protein